MDDSQATGRGLRVVPSTCYLRISGTTGPPKHEEKWPARPIRQTVPWRAIPATVRHRPRQAQDGRPWWQSTLARDAGGAKCDAGRIPSRQGFERGGCCGAAALTCVKRSDTRGIAHEGPPWLVLGSARGVLPRVAHREDCKNLRQPPGPRAQTLGLGLYAERPVHAFPYWR